MEEEGAVIVGLLVGLNVIDANLCVKGEDLDSQVGVIDFSMYLKNEEDIGNKERYDFHKLFHRLYFSCTALYKSL